MKPLCVLCDTFQHQQLLAWHLHLSKTFLLRTSTSLATIFAVAGWFGAALRFDSQSRSFRHRMAPKLIYFALPGRAEVARLMFSISGKQFEDQRLTFDEWRANGDLKAATPFGQLPVLEVDGKHIAQSAAIDHYVAKETGMLPSDPLTAALADQAYFFCEDIWQVLAPTMRIQDPDEKIKAREAAVAGPLADKLKLLSKLLKSRPGKFVSGDKLTHGDLAIFCRLSTLQCGWLDGIPTNILESCPVLKDFHNSIASLPEVVAFYSNENDDIRNNGFKPRP